MRARVDGNRCQGHGRCAAEAPEVFELDELGYSRPGPRLVPAGLETQARRAGETCPERAIAFEEDGGTEASPTERSAR